jgi:uncharacterized protein
MFRLPMRPSFTRGVSMPVVPLILGLLTVFLAATGPSAAALAAASTAGTPSFNCRAASTPAEHQICGNPKLADWDRALAERFAAVMDLLDTQGRDRLRAEQKTWLATGRDPCDASPDPATCLERAMSQRVLHLEAAITAALDQMGRLLASIPDAPEAAARQLGERKGPDGHAWMAYIQRFGPRPDPVTAITTLSAAVEALRDDFPRNIAGQQDLSSDAGFLTALRLVGDVSGLALPCFVLARHGAAAWNAIEPVYGSSRDSASPLPACRTGSSLADHPAWKRVSEHLAPLNQLAAARSGTIRSSVGRAQSVAWLKADLDPLQFGPLRSGTAPVTDIGDVMARLKAWRNPRWAAPGRVASLGDDVTAALESWTRTLSSRTGVNAMAARRIAGAIAAEVLGIQVEFIEENVDLTADTRLPDWLQGAWRWPRGESRLAPPFDKPAEAASIDAMRICVAGEGDCVDVEALAASEAEMEDAIAGAGALTPPRAPARPVRAVALDGAPSPLHAIALLLDDGSVLIHQPGQPVVLTRARGGGTGR